VFIAMGAPELGHSEVDHLGVLVKVAFLGEFNVADLANVWPLTSVRSQMIKVFAHRKY